MLTNIEFKALLTKGAHPHEAIRKDIVPQGIADIGDRRLRFVVSTDAVDRDLDKINQAGWQLDNYRTNPVVLLHHDQKDWPVGKAVEIDVVDGQLMATVEFVPEEVPLAGPTAECAYQLCRSGFLNAVSVGFVPGDYDLSEDDDRSKAGAYPGVDHNSQELLEFSLVTVPSNAQALMVNDDPMIPVEPQAVTTMSIDTAVEKAKRARIMRIMLLG